MKKKKRIIKFGFCSKSAHDKRKAQNDKIKDKEIEDRFKYLTSNREEAIRQGLTNETANLILKEN